MESVCRCGLKREDAAAADGGATRRRAWPHGDGAREKDGGTTAAPGGIYGAPKVLDRGEKSRRKGGKGKLPRQEELTGDGGDGAGVVRLGAAPTAGKREDGAGVLLGVLGRRGRRWQRGGVERAREGGGNGG